MRRIVLASLVVVALVWLVASGSTIAATSTRLPVDPAVSLTEHSFVGNWQIITASGTVPLVLEADGSIMLAYPDTAFGADGYAYVGAAFGTWVPISARDASFSAMQTISHANGVHLGSVTIDGYLTMSDDPAAMDVVASVTHVTTRDASNNIVSVAAPDPAGLLGNGGRDCVTCAGAYHLQR